MFSHWFSHILIGDSVFVQKMPRILRRHLNSIAIGLSPVKSAMSKSHMRKEIGPMDMTRARTSLILCFTLIFCVVSNVV